MLSKSYCNQTHTSSSQRLSRHLPTPHLISFTIAAVWDTASSILVYVVLGVLLVGNAVGVILVVMQLPGTWLILAMTAAVAWWQWDEGVIGLWAIGILVGLAVVGELVEFAASTIGTAKAGGSKWASVGSLIGGVVGAVVGSFFMPPLGTILGACLVAGTGSMLGDQLAGRSWSKAVKTAKGAAVGKLWGTAGKVAVALVMWVVAAVAVFWP